MMHTEKVIRFPEHQPQVFCGACRYLQGDGCAHPSALQEYVTWKETVYARLRAAEKNAENDCQDFAGRRVWDALAEHWPILALGLLALAGWLIMFTTGGK